jgi:methylmalonyl-CoA/ethylmalonyl-CoA epimerase
MGAARKPKRNAAASGRVLGIDHVAIAVRSLDEKVALFRRVLGVEPRSIEDLPKHGVRVALFVLGKDRIELLEPLGDASPVAKFLDARGEGLHHVSLSVDDVGSALARLEALGVPLIDRTPRPGAERKRVAFIHPKGVGGILFELSESPPRPARPRARSK